MTAIVCLRLLIDDEAFPAARAHEAADAYLKDRWIAPRRYGAVASLAFVLADLRAERLNPEEIQELAARLEALLFPGQAHGQICLMTFEGDEQAVLKFATLSQTELAALAAGRGYGGAAGHVQAITADAIQALPSAPASRPATPPQAPQQRAAPAAAAAPPSATGWWGLYDLPGEAFVGSLLGLRSDLTQPPPEGDAALLSRDLTCLNDAQSAIKSAPFGDFLVPFGFWNLTTPHAQDAYRSRLSRYPLDLQPRLGASVYGTPREASLGLVSQIRTFLKGSFAVLDLNVLDPTFPLHTFPPELINSVTLTLTGEDDRARLNAILKLVERHATYQGKGVLPCVAGVNSAAEVEACRQGGIARISGPAVSPFLDKPLAQAEGTPLSLARNAA